MKYILLCALTQTKTMQSYYALTAVLLLLSRAQALDYPGTVTRPILSEDEAKEYTMENYFDGWEPQDALPETPDYVVKEGQSIQAVVNEAIANATKDTRVYIQIEPGHYMETVYIAGEALLTIYGNQESIEDVHIMSTLSAQTTVDEYKMMVNENGSRYKEGDPAWELYATCASKTDVIGTECSAVFWVASADFELFGVTVHNGAIDAQAVAIKTAADKIHLMNDHFLGMQDTVGLGIEDNQLVERVMVHMCYIEGETDYVYGSAAAVFEMTTFYTVTTVPDKHPVIFAPDTAPLRRYGFLVVNSNITGDPSYEGTNSIKLARAWDRSIKSPELYVPDSSPNGQLVIRDSNIDNVIDVEAPYAAAATSGRAFSTDISDDRDLNDNTHNRLWEFNNYGAGA